MPLTLDWLLPQQVLYTTLQSPVGAAEASALHQQLPGLLQTLPEDAKAHFLIDATRLNALPDLDTLRQLAYFKHRQLDWVLLISPHSSLRVKLMNKQLSLIKAHFRQVADWDRALANLHAIDPSLPEIKQP